MGMINERRWLTWIFSLYILLAVGYSLLMPIWEAPDEPAHYHIAWHLARIGRYPTMKLNYEANQPKTFYYLGAWVIHGLDKIDTHLSDYYLPHEYKQNIRTPVRRFDWTDENYRFLLGVYALRWVNILIGAFGIWLNWKAFQLITPEKPKLRLAAVALTALTPQFLHITSSVNNDILGALAGAFLFYLVIRIMTTHSNILALISIALTLILPLMAKLTVLPVSAALLILVAWKWLFHLPQKRWLIISGLSILIGAGVIYFFFPGTFQTASSEITWRLFSLRKNALTYKYLKFIFEQIIWTYWGKVGWLAVGLPKWSVILLTAFGLIGSLMNAYNLIKTRVKNPQFNAWVATWLIVFFTLAAVIRNGLTTNATQGRFLFPAIGALSLLMVSGWHSMLPQRYRDYLPVIVVSIMLFCNLILWQFGVLPVYYQPFLD